jgi:hypothetical protein
MHSYWQRNGPPLNVALQVVGQVLGIEWQKKPEMPDFDPGAPTGPSIAELAMGMKPL